MQPCRYAIITAALGSRPESVESRSRGFVFYREAKQAWRLVGDGGLALLALMHLKDRASLCWNADRLDGRSLQSTE